MKYILISLVILIIQISENEYKLDISNDEYEIFSTIIDSLYLRSSTERVVICDSTNDNYLNGVEIKPRKLNPNYLKIYISNFSGSDSINIFNSITQNNKSKLKINSGKFMFKPKVEILGIKEFQSIFQQAEIKVDGWRKFYRKYPSSTGYILFCRPGFNKLRNKAFIIVENYCGDTCGEGIYYFLEKVNSIWKIKKSRHIWES